MRGFFKGTGAARTNLRILSLLTLSILIIQCSLTSYAETKEIRFVARDTEDWYSSAYQSANKLYIMCDNGAGNITLTNEAYWNISGDNNYGNVTLDFSDKDCGLGDIIWFKLTGGSNEIILFYDLDVLFNGTTVVFTPWNSSWSVGDQNNGDVLARNLSDTWLNLGLRNGHNGGDVAIIRTAPLALGSELVINQSDLKFDKTVYKVNEGDVIQINVTIHNTGFLNESSANVSLYINDVLNQTLAGVRINAGSSKLVQFNKTARYGNKNYLKIKALVSSNNPLQEGVKTNNYAEKYIVKSRPYLFFTDPTTTYGYLHRTESPYSSWISSLGTAAAACLNTDYTSSSASEATKAECATTMAAYYLLNTTSRTNYANKVITALSYIGEGSGTYVVNRSLDGKSTPNSYDNISNEIYGISTSGDTWRDMLYYGIAYDWIHSYAEDNDMDSNLTVIRDKLGRLGADLYLINREITSYYDAFSGGSGVSLDTMGDYGEGKIEASAALGVIGLSIMDYDGQYDDLDGYPAEWIRFSEEDMLTSSQSGAIQPIVRQLQSEDGMFQEGGGYRAYYQDGEFYYYSAYKDTFKDKSPLAEKYAIVRGALSYLPFTKEPNGAYPNYCVSYANKWSSEYIALNALPVGTPERKIVNKYINETLTISQGLSSTGMSNYEKIFTYNKTEPYDGINNSWTSENMLMHSYRSSDDIDALYFFLKSHNETAMSGHQPTEPDQLTFDLWAKGAYLVPDASDSRYVTYAGDSQAVKGHTAFRVSTDSEFVQLVKSKGVANATCNDPSYIRKVLSTDNLDFVEGDLYATVGFLYPSYYTIDNPFTYQRSLLAIGGEYLVDMQRFNSTASNDYQLIIPLGSAQGNIGTSSDYDNYCYGNLTMDNGSAYNVNWFNYTNPELNSSVLIKTNHSGVKEIIWKTKSYTDSLHPTSQKVNLSVFMNPSSGVYINHVTMHYGGYGVTSEWVIPVAEISRAGSNIKQLNVFYPTNTTDAHPTVTQLSLAGGSGNDYATKITQGALTDIIIASDGESITAGELSTDARIAFAREDGGSFNSLFINDGSILSYDGVDRFSSTEDVAASLKYEGSQVFGEVLGTGSYDVTITTDFSPTLTIDYVRFNGLDVDYEYNNVTGVLTTTLDGEGDFVVVNSGAETTTTTTTTTTTSSTTTTTLAGECELIGDYPPCGDITLAEVVDLIHLWVLDQATLQEVVDLIHGWVNS